MKTGHHLKLKHCLKHWLFEYYAIISATFFIGTLLLFFNGRFDWQTLLAIEGGIITFALGVQKQRLDEVHLFNQLFTDFNERYDQKNEAMNLIYNKPPESKLTDKEVETLFNYFNLCGEEYLYYTRGFIFPEVWCAWFNGMKFFRNNQQIKQLWDKDLRAGSYYGLDFDDSENCRGHEKNASED
jgi:hypothetical protein